MRADKVRTIKSFCHTGSGTTPARTYMSKYYGGEIPWVKSSELRESEITDTEEHVTRIALSETSLKIVPPDAILIAMYGATVGRVGFLKVPATTNQAVCHIIPDPEIAIPRYVYHALRSLKSHFVRQGVGGAQPNISQKILQDTKIWLPTIEEQSRIVEVIEQTDLLRAKNSSAILASEKLTQANFISNFMNETASSWNEVAIADVSRSMRTGPFGSQLLHSEFSDQGVAVLGIDNAVHNEFAWGERRYVTEEKYRQLSRYRVYPRDVIITIMGTCGRAAIVPDDIPTAITTKHLCSLTLDETRCLPEYLHACFLRHPLVLKQLGVKERGAVMPGLNMQIIKETRIPLPPLDLQRAFAARVAEIDKLKALHRAHRAKLDELFASLQHRAFRGEL